MMAFFPGTVLAQLHGLMRDVREAMSLLAVVTQVLVTVSILAGLVILTRIFARGLACCAPSVRAAASSSPWSGATAPR
jgi:putative ABC transport system permease protein